MFRSIRQLHIIQMMMLRTRRRRKNVFMVHYLRMLNYLIKNLILRMRWLRKPLRNLASTNMERFRALRIVLLLHHINSKMGQYMLVSGRSRRGVEGGSNIGLMDQFMKDTGIIILPTERGD